MKKIWAPVFLLCVSLSTFSMGITNAQASGSSSTVLAACENDTDFTCGSIAIPRISISGVKKNPRAEIKIHRAASNSGSKGTIFYNPGGPAISAVDTLKDLVSFLDPRIVNDNDIVAIDPIGVGDSDGVVCITPSLPEQHYGVLPSNYVEFKDHLNNVDPIISRTCSSEFAMGSIAQARDIEYIRVALGLKSVTFLGVSYGSILATVYAKLYPRSVSSLIVDSPVDPYSSYQSNGQGIWARIGIPATSQEALMSAIGLCESIGIGRCPVALTIRSSFERVMNRLQVSTINAGKGRAVDLSSFESYVSARLYHFNSLGIDDFELLFDQIIQLANASELGTGAEPPVAVDDVGLTDLIIRLSRMNLVLCSDYPQIDNALLPADAMISELKSPGFGYYYAAMTSSCRNGDRGQGRVGGLLQSGPQLPRTIVFENSHDPVSSTQAAVHVKNMSSRASVVTVSDWWGHGALRASKCTNEELYAFLRGGRGPFSGSRVCAPNQAMFP
ncbi:alpha/beta fold hydrolase [Propionibacterium freudenreichii]|uniref:alpha/beta fold hydrolase n=1 Tax=Propionibacterium freudenreichii TaxID=1744 RepID=UPI0009BD1604|nr:alpha/beta fold hydrolase [Propionibacterium freudenreichii]